jgi:hypothetical protein
LNTTTVYRQACWLLAERRLKHVLVSGRFVAHRDRWLETTAAQVGAEHQAARLPAELDTPQAVADYLEPDIVDRTAENAARARVARAHWDNHHCRTCDGTGWTWHTDGVRPCPNCDKVPTHRPPDAA